MRLLEPGSSLGMSLPTFIVSHVVTNVCSTYYVRMAASHHPIAEQLAWLAIQPIDELTRDACLAHLEELGRVTRFVQGLHSRYAARLDAVSPTPEADHTQATRGSTSSGKQATRRGRGRRNSGAAGEALGHAMDHGDVSGEHLDAFLSVQATLPAEIRSQFCADNQRISAWATHYDVTTFTKLLRRLADDLRRQHGISQLEQQRRDTYLDTWIDQRGMLRLSGAFDPESALRLRAALDAAVDAMHREPTPAHCPGHPDDPAARQRFLRAHALLRLIHHGPDCTSGTPRAELVVIADTTQLTHQGEPTLDWGLPIELPLEALTRFYESIDRTTIVDITRHGIIRNLEPLLDLGRTTRLANRAQRRLLRALHPTCIVPGCPTPFQFCEIHHLTWWRHGGATSLSNLAPVCPRHHSRVHHDGWQITLDHHRNVTLTLPDGTTLTSHHTPPHFDVPVGVIPSLGP